MLSKEDTLTPEQLAEIEEAKRAPIVFDEDCPDLTPEMEAAFLRAAAERNARRRGEARRAAGD